MPRGDQKKGRSARGASALPLSRRQARSRAANSVFSKRRASGLSPANPAQSLEVTHGLAAATLTPMPYRRSANGFWRRMVSCRSAPTLTAVTGTPTSCSMRSTYARAVGGRSS